MKNYSRFPSSRIAAFYLGENPLTGKFHWQHMEAARMRQIFEHIKNDDMAEEHRKEIKSILKKLT
jgi:hypothetical protein